MTGCFIKQIMSKRQKKQLRLESRKRNNAVSLRRPATNQEKMKTVNDFHKLERVHCKSVSTDLQTVARHFGRLERMA